MVKKESVRKISPTKIRKVRDATGAPVLRAKKVLESTGGDEKKAIDILTTEGHEKIAKRSHRETGEGIIASYVHHNNKVAALVELMSETDFVARNELFVSLGQDLAMQVASLGAKNASELEKQDFIKDTSKKVSDLVSSVAAKTGENVRIGRLFRIELGK